MVTVRNRGTADMCIKKIKKTWSKTEIIYYYNNLNLTYLVLLQIIIKNE